MTPPSRPGSASSPLAASEQLWQWLLAACALGLGSFRLTHKNLWVDEAASAGFALGGPSAWVADHNMALYYMLLSAWVRVFGSSELALRAPSVLCFAASVPLLYRVARSSFGERTARFASALHVGNAFMLQFAQEARGYMLAVLLVLCAQLALVRLLERPERRWSILYGVSLGLASYAHLFAIWTLLAHALVLAPRWLRSSTERAAGLGAFGLAALLSLPVFVQVANVGAEQVSWIRPPTLRAASQLPVIWTGGGALLALCVWLLFALFARAVSARDEHTRLHTQLCVAWLCVPFGAAWLVSVCVAPMLLPKYLISALPALQLGAAETLARWPRRWALPIGGVLLVLTGLRIEDWYTAQQKERWSEAVQQLSAGMLPAEPLILDLPCPEPFDYYVKQQHLDQRWPAPRWPVRAWAFPTADEQPVTRSAVIAQLDRELPERIWLIDNRSAQPPELGALAAHYRVASEQRLTARGDSADAWFGAQGALVISIRMLVRL